MLISLPDRRKRRRGLLWGTASLVFVCLAVMLFMETLPPQARDQFINRYGAIPARILTQGDQWELLLPLVTALFIHADWLHLLGNLAFLWLFGLPCERVMGSLRTIGFFLTAGALANFMVALQAPEVTSPVIGASGAVSAMVAGYLVLYPGARMGLVVPLGLYIQFIKVPALLVIGSWAALQVFYTLFIPQFGAIAWWAHLTGFIAGLLLVLPLGIASGMQHHR